ncbi:MAG: hypothetical protein V1651_03790, partial [Patescibacteria group bacterium]
KTFYATSLSNNNLFRNFFDILLKMRLNKDDATPSYGWQYNRSLLIFEKLTISPRGDFFRLKRLFLATLIKHIK